MTENRKRKFRRWAEKGVPTRAPMVERFAFGAFLTNRRKRIGKVLGVLSGGKANKYETKRTRGKWTEVQIDQPLTALDSPAFRNHVAAFIWEFHKRHRGSVGFFRILIQAAENPYSAFPFNGPDGGTAEHWFGSAAFKEKGGVADIVGDLFGRIVDDVLPFDNGEGRIIRLHVYTVRNKRK